VRVKAQWWRICVNSPKQSNALRAFLIPNEQGWIAEGQGTEKKG